LSAGFESILENHADQPDDGKNTDGYSQHPCNYVFTHAVLLEKESSTPGSHSDDSTIGVPRMMKMHETCVASEHWRQSHSTGFRTPEFRRGPINYRAVRTVELHRDSFSLFKTETLWRCCQSITGVHRALAYIEARFNYFPPFSSYWSILCDSGRSDQL